MWPALSGPVVGVTGESWIKINCALWKGNRGLPGGTTLATLLRPFRTTSYRLQSPQLSLEEVLAWCDAHHRRTGAWPTHESGRITEAPRETWENIRCALKDGRRGLPKSGSLAQLLSKHRGRFYDRKHIRGRTLTKQQILAWADAYHDRTARWPGVQSGRIAGTPDETWLAVDLALRHGLRGLPEGSSLARLLRKLPGSRRNLKAPPLSREQILIWADAHYARTRRWPNSRSGPIHGAPDESWENIDKALKICIRGLRPPVYPTGPNDEGRRDSLYKLLRRFRSGLAPPRMLTELTEKEILAWADEHHERTGRWPTRFSGRIQASRDNTWAAVNSALMGEGRGLRGKSTLAILLAEKRGKRLKLGLPPLSEDLVLRWADAHHRRTGRWPKRDSGPIPELLGETWATVCGALYAGNRGVRPSSLTALLENHRGIWPGGSKPRLTVDTIRKWAEAHYERRGRWPTIQSGPIEGVQDETWLGINSALRKGSRSLAGGGSLSSLLAGRKAAARGERAKPPLTIGQVLLWAKAHARRYGAWPETYSGKVDDAPGETWIGIDQALSDGQRGLPAHGSLKQFLAGHRRPAKRQRT